MTFFGCHVTPGDPTTLQWVVGHQLQLTHAALSKASKPKSAARLSVRTGRIRSHRIVCTLGPRCEQSTVSGLTIDESDLATLEVDGGGSVDVCGCWVRVGPQADSEEDKDCVQSEDGESGGEESGEEGGGQEESGDEEESGEESGEESSEEESDEEEEQRLFNAAQRRSATLGTPQVLQPDAKRRLARQFYELSPSDADTTLLQPNSKRRLTTRHVFELSRSDAPFAAPTPPVHETRNVGTQAEGGEDEIEERKGKGKAEGKGKGKGKGTAEGKGEGKGAERPPGGRRWHGSPAGGKGKGRGSGKGSGKGRGKGKGGGHGGGMRGWGKDGEGRARKF